MFSFHFNHILQKNFPPKKKKKLQNKNYLLVLSLSEISREKKEKYKKE